MKPLTKLKAKYIKSLQLKKNRNQEGCFIVEGEKSVLEFIRSDFKVKEVICTEEFIANLTPDEEMFEVYTCSASVLSGLGSFKSNNTALAVVEVKQDADFKIRNDTVILAIDQINDPGNLGTIIRIADWFGLETVLLSTNSVDVYNPKVVSASKGSLTRVNVRNVDLEEVFSDYKGNILAADL
ncbi:MAG: TrmH family RNA methyltransferase, partial [Bacteroidota bacterium]